MRALFPVALMASALLACRYGNPRSQVDTQLGLCRASAALQKDAVAREVAINNCEQEANRRYAEIEHQENLQAYENERQRQVEAEQQRKDAEELEHVRAAEQRRNEKLAALRRAPTVPEMGATSVECRDACAVMDGEVRVTRTDAVTVSCLVGGELVWLVEVRPQQGVFTVSSVRAFYEDADPLALRSKVEERLGPATEVAIVRDRRMWTWIRENLTVTVGSYDDGAFTSTTLVPTEASPPVPPTDAGQERAADVLSRDWPGE